MDPIRVGRVWVIRLSTTHPVRSEWAPLVAAIATNATTVEVLGLTVDSEKRGDDALFARLEIQYEF